MVRWREGTALGADAEQVWIELNAISSEGLTPEAVVARARKGGELHKCFIWDDAKAAEVQRLAQARYIINHLVVSVTDPDDEKTELDVSYYTSVPGADGRTYIPTIQSLAQPDLRQMILNEAIRLFKQGKEKLAMYNLLSRASAEMIQQIIKRLYRRARNKKAA